MSNGVSKILIAGSSGPGFEEFLSNAREPGFQGEIETIAGARQESWGKRIGETAVRNFPEYEDMVVVSIEEALRNSDADVAVSFLRDDAAEQYERYLSEVGVLITNSSFHRMDPDTALANPYTNPAQIDELFSSRERAGRINAIGNCTSLILTPAFAPLHARWGILSAEVVTHQGYSGAGAFEVPEGVTKPVPIEGDEQAKIQNEPARLLSDSRDELVSIDIEATPNRGVWWRGHHEKVIVRLAKPATAREIEEAWHDWRAPDVLDDVAYGENSPHRKPIKVSDKPLIRWENGIPELRSKVLPMRVKAFIHEVQDDGHTIIFDLLGDNLALGSAGSVAMNLSYMREMGYLK